MFDKKLLYLGGFNSKFNGKEYNVCKFVDIYTYTIIYGSNLENVEKLQPNKMYDCEITINDKKLKVTKVHKIGE